MTIQTVTPGTPLSITLAQGSFLNVTVPANATAVIYRTGADGTPVIESIVGGPVKTKVGPHLDQRTHVIDARGLACTVEDTVDGGSTAAYTGAIATRCYQPNVKHGSNKGGQYKTYHQFEDDAAYIIVRYPNYYVTPPSPGTEASTGGPATFKLGLERADGTFVQVTFSASTTGTIPAGSFLDSDPIPVPNAKRGEAFWLRPNIYIPAGQIIYTSVPSWGAAPGAVFGEGTAAVAGVPTDLTMGGAIAQSSGGVNYYPIAIFGATTRRTVLSLADSRGMGIGDLPDLTGKGCVGEFERPLSIKNACINAGVGSDRAALFNASSVIRRGLGQYVSDIVISLGINDIRDGTSAAALLAIIQSIVAALATAYPGKPIYIATLGPVTTSTDSWATDANQTVTAVEAARVAYNNLLRTTRLANVAGIIDMADSVETYRDSGKWKTNGVAFFYTPDGLHSSQNGYIEQSNKRTVVSGIASIAA